MSGDLDDLNRKLEAFKNRSEDRLGSQQEKDANNMNIGMRAGSELIGCIGAGAALGYFTDKWLSTQPLFLIIFLIAGIGAAFLNIYKITMGIGSSVGFAPLHKGEKKAKNAPNNEESD